MAYTKTTFVNGQAPAVSAEQLNKIGTGVEEAHVLAENAGMRSIIKTNLTVNLPARTGTGTQSNPYVYTVVQYTIPIPTNTKKLTFNNGLFSNTHIFRDSNVYIQEGNGIQEKLGSYPAGTYGTMSADLVRTSYDDSNYRMFSTSQESRIVDMLISGSSLVLRFCNLSSSVLTETSRDIFVICEG